MTEQIESFGKYLNMFFRVKKKHPHLRFGEIIKDAFKSEIDLKNVSDVEVERKIKEHYAECFNT